MTREERKNEKGEKRLARYKKKEMKNFERKRGRRRIKAANPYRVLMLFFAFLSLTIGVLVTGDMLVSGILLHNIWHYAGLLAFFITLFIVVLIYTQANHAVHKTKLIKVHDMPAIVADGFERGAHVFSVPYRGTNPNTGKEFDTSTKIEAIWGGSLKNWPGHGKGPLILAICQYTDEGGTEPKYAGFLEGDTYHIPSLPEPMRADLFKNCRLDVLWDKLKNLETIGDRIRPSTEVIVAYQPVALPTAVPQHPSAVNELELWTMKRILNKQQAMLQKMGVGEEVLARLGVD